MEYTRNTYEKQSEIHFDRLLTKHRDCKGNKCNPVLDKLQGYRRNWLQHINRTPCKRLSRILEETADQQAEEARGRPIKRLLDV
jgi:hypothetical protein